VQVEKASVHEIYEYFSLLIKHHIDESVRKTGWQSKQKKSILVVRSCTLPGTKSAGRRILRPASIRHKSFLLFKRLSCAVGFPAPKRLKNLRCITMNKDFPQ
jgi:hypothetical protein